MNLNKILRNKKLSLTLVSIILLISLIFTFLQTIFILNSDYNKSIKIVNSSIEQIKNTQLKAISLSIWQLDTNQLNILIDGILKMPGITFVKITENDSKVIEAGNKKNNYTIENTFDLIHKNLEDTKLGTIYIQGSYEKNIDIIKNKVIETILIETLKVFSIAFILIFIVHKLIMRHLVTMAEYTKNLDSKKLSTPLKLEKETDSKYPDTIDIVVDAINTMRENILSEIEKQQQSKLNLEQINNKLKEEVKIRTKIEKDALEQKERIQNQYNTIVKLTIDNKLFEKSFEEGLRFLLKECSKTLKTDRVSYWVLENEHILKCTYRYLSDKDIHIKEKKTINISKIPKFFECIKSHKVVDAFDVYTDQRTKEYNYEDMKKSGIKSMLDIGINFHDKLYGIICFETIKEKKLWTQDEISFASRVSDQINNLLMISEWGKVQKEILKLNSSLEKTVEIRTKELKENIQNLQVTQKQLVQNEKMASLGGLVAGVAHEINTPIGISLTGITHFQHITNELKNLYENHNLSEEEFKEYIKTSYDISSSVYTSLIRAAELIKSFKQVAVDQSNEHVRNFNIKEYFEEILLSLHNKIKKTKHTINIDCDDNLNISSYPGAISQIITNFIINSMIHGFKDIESGNITITAKKIDNNIEIIYKDNGVGVNEENLKKIFDPFFTTNREAGGSGLGLNIVYNIVKNRLHGEIEAKSTFGHGITFIFNFPVENSKS